MTKYRTAWMAAAAGTCCGIAAAQTGLINVSGATLLENYVRSNASTHDFIDVDGNGVAGYLFSGIQQLASAGPSNTSQVWGVQYRVVGSVNGFIELTLNGRGSGATGDDTAPSPLGIRGARGPAVVDGRASFAYHNRVLYITSGNQNPTPALYNSGNPGGAPLTTNAMYQAIYASPGTSAGGFLEIDVSPLDVSTTLAVRKDGQAKWDRAPADAGYGQNPVLSGTRPFGSAGFGNLPSTLADLNGRNLFDPNNPGAADANTIFDTSLAFAPIAPVINPGTAMRRATMTELQYLFTTGRAASGENLVVMTRDVGSGTRNALMNCIGVDPSWGVGDNIGGLSTAANNHTLGASFTPTNKGSNGGMETALRNVRLGIGYVGTERGVTGSGSGSWLTTGALEIPDIKNDLYGGTEYVRPTTQNIVNNSDNGWLIGGQAVLATIGDPLSNASSLGGQGWVGAFDPFVDLNCDGVRQINEPFTDLNGNGLFDATNAEAGLPARVTPPMANPYAAAYMNNISRSIDATTNIPSDPGNFGMPGEFAASQFLLLAALDRLHLDGDYTQMVTNSGKNNCVQQYTLSNNVHNNPAFAAFNESACGRVPARTTGATYSDGVLNGLNYIRQGTVGTPDVPVSYGGVLDCRNKIAGDFSGDSARDAGDVTEMMKAYAQRYSAGNPRWNAPSGAAGSGEQAIIEVLGDFDGNGSFDAVDVRYFADGLYLTNGNLDRMNGFIAVDTAWAAAPGGDNNFFNTTLATGKTYAAGDSAGDLVGSATGVRRGYSPTGADGVVNAADIDYVFAQYNNVFVTDGAANWADLDEAVGFDLSADLNGDLIVDGADIEHLVTVILGTEIGDVNLDGVRDCTDAEIALANLGSSGGWAMGDVDGDGVVTENDITIITTGTCCGCAADYNADGGVDGGDVEAFFTEWEQSIGCADVNQDGGIDGGDVEAFFNLWEAGGC